MADKKIRLLVKAEVQKAVNNLNKLEKKTDKTKRSASELTSTFQGLFGAAVLGGAARSVVQTASNFESLQVRLVALKGSTEEGAKAFNQFTNLDFNDLRTQIKNYLRSSSSFTDFDFEGSNFSVLIDTLAYNSYITSYNTNMAVNESFIDSATLRENVVSLARNIGYVPRSKKSAIARITFSIDITGKPVQTVKLHKGIVAVGSLQGGNYIFSIPDDITATPNSSGIVTFENISIYEGTYLTKTFKVNDSLPDQKYIIPNESIDTSTVRVTVKSNVTENYVPYTNIFDVNKDSRLFLIQEIEDEKYQIIFGDNTLGKKPADKSTIEVSYIMTNGIEGNDASNFNFSGKLTYMLGGVETSIDDGITSLSTLQAAENGDEIESIDNIKYLAPRVYASQYRAVTPNDYSSLIPFLYPNIDSVSAYGGEELDPPQYGKVFITVKPKMVKYYPQ